MSVGFLFPLLFIVPFLAMLAWILFFALGSKLKGDITIDLGNPLIAPGRDIAGVAVINAKKPLGPGRLYVSLVCTEEWYERDHDSDGRSSRTRKTEEVYRHDVDVANGLTLAAGARHIAPFVLPTPQPHDPAPEEQNRSGLARALDALSDAFSPDRDRYWSIEARYDIKGLDLVDEERVPLHYEF